MIPRESRSLRLGELSRELGAVLDGDPQLEIRGVAALDEATPEQIAALYRAGEVEAALASRAGALIVSEALSSSLEGRSVLIAKSPKAAMARAMECLNPRVPVVGGVHETAVVDPSAEVAESACIGALSVISARCRIGEGASIGPGCVLLEDVDVADGVVLHPRVVVYAGCVIERNAEVFAGAVVGAPGFGHARDEQGEVVRIPHLGSACLEEGSEVGANTTIDRGTFGTTRIGSRARLDNLVQVGHNVELGVDSLVAGQSGLSGSCRVGRGVMIGGQSGVADHVVIGDGVAVAAKTAVLQDVDAGQVVAGTPAMPIGLWRRLVAVESRLPEVWVRLRNLLERERDGSGGNGKGEGDPS